uniref:Uncharacterized protein n=1 Tax=Cyclophora tenuis TaxID=216820 RepID=A0A7S1GN04_CYCTE|mmetsp:Transcript_2575/g.4409  ORF Transcript_2575/g.4409 Transcript_2575/m.4409 type:complete len:251 (+) Transcript_2575:8-760(+)
MKHQRDEGNDQSAPPVPLRPNSAIVVPKATPVAPKTSSAQLPVKEWNKRLKTTSGCVKAPVMIRSTAPAKRKEGVSPVVYLRSLHPPSTCRIKRYDGMSFARPRDEDLAAYDSAVVTALRKSDLGQLRAMHTNGKSMNACNQFGESLLHMACRRADVKVVKLLVLEFHVRVDVRDDYGRTPLHDACWTTTPNFELMDVLVEAVDPRLLLAEDVRGHTPFDYARREHWNEWLQFLKDRKERLQRTELKVVA